MIWSTLIYRTNTDQAGRYQPAECHPVRAQERCQWRKWWTSWALRPAYLVRTVTVMWTSQLLKQELEALIVLRSLEKGREREHYRPTRRPAHAEADQCVSVLSGISFIDVTLLLLSVSHFSMNSNFSPRGREVVGNCWDIFNTILGHKYCQNHLILRE